MELGAKLFDMHMVGFFLYANVVSPWLMFLPSVIVLRVNYLSVAVSRFPVFLSRLPPVSRFPVFLSCLPPLLVLSVSFCFPVVVVCLVSAFTGSRQTADIFSINEILKMKTASFVILFLCHFK